MIQATTFQQWGNKDWNTPLTVEDMPEGYAPTYDELEGMAGALGFKWFTDPFDLNFGGIRNDLEEKADVEGDDDEILLLHENVFNDIIWLAWKDTKGNKYVKAWIGTTDPGFYWRQKPGRGVTKGGKVRGVGAIREGQHLQIYYPGMHGTRPALQQEEKPVIVYRDNDLNKVLKLNPAKTQKGRGFRFHYMGKFLENVNRWSGGCNGSNDPDCVPFILGMVQRQEDAGHGNRVSYTVTRLSWHMRAREGDEFDWAKEEYEIITGFEVGLGV